MTTLLADIGPSAPVGPSIEREGVNITLGALEPGTGAAASAVWSVAGWTIQFVRLGTGETLGLGQDQGAIYIKVVTGDLVDLERGPFADPMQVRSTLVESDSVQAGTDGALITVFTETSSATANIESMAELTISGPSDDSLRWQRFDEKFGQFTDIFNGADAYMSSGFHLLDDDGTEITYVNLWTAGKGVNLSTHNHGNEPSPVSPAFAEVHWVFNNGTGSGGMYSCDAPDGPKHTRYPMQRGQEHGSFFVVAPDGSPKLRDNGAVEYPWHGWEAGTDDRPGQAFDFVAAFETNPDYVKL
ncbi:MAG: hypothetical protein OES38_17590 [Gammaproteobacteria bacterium]|nr:hypothetical protein [Gammaproteobacteria bacterium]